MVLHPLPNTTWILYILLYSTVYAIVSAISLAQLAAMVSYDEMFVGLASSPRYDHLQVNPKFAIVYVVSPAPLPQSHPRPLGILDLECW